MDAVSWDNLPSELVSIIANKLDCLETLLKFSGVCKSWNSCVSESKLSLPKDPWLLLAEDSEFDLSSILVTELEAIPHMVDINYIDNNDDNLGHGNHHANNNDGDRDNNDDDQIEQVDRIITSIGDLFENVRSSVRDFYSIVKQKVYHLDLPEAAGRVILGTDKGWLLTLGSDLEINLLHPLTRYQIPLPPIPSLEYDDNLSPLMIYTWFFTKVAMSSQVPPAKSHDTCNLPTIMAIYGEFRLLGFVRLGEKSWKHVETNTRVFHDIVYHKEKFYAIDCHGAIFMCDIDDEKEGQSKGIQITSIPIEKSDWVQSYLIQSLSGSHLWVVLRYRRREYYRGEYREPFGPVKPLTPGELRYYTSDFLVFKLEILLDSNCDEFPACRWSATNVKDVGKETLFLGLSSSTSVASSEFIKPNSIYFTDDEMELYHEAGGGHDMGIFDIETGVFEPHFPGSSIHPFSPPVWYI